MKYRFGHRSYGYGRYGRKVLTGSISQYSGWEKKGEGTKFLGTLAIIFLVGAVVLTIVCR
jgi:hypothetical protein